MNRRTIALVASVVLGAMACKDSTSVTDLNNVSADALAGGLTRSSTGLLATGMLNASRGEVDGRYLVFSETMARDEVRLDNAEARFVTELIGGPADYSAFTGTGAFGNMYVTIRSANTLLNALPNAAGLTPAELAATSGLARTYKALAYYRALEFRDSLGIALDVNHPINDPPAPFVCKTNALAFISALLDSAATDLAAGGSAFPFPIPAGFTANGSFDTPATFLKVNRGLKGKVEFYRGMDHARPNAASFAAAIVAINASFADRNASPNLGIYNTYSTAANESTNPLADANVYLNQAVGDSVQAGDRRAVKIIAVTPKTLNGVTTTYKSTLTDPAAARALSMGVLKNAELLLLRAQAEIETGDFANATADVNAVRVSDGGLAPLPLFTTKRAARDAVLYEKRYSLLTESAHRLVDLRAYGWLNATFFKKETAADIFQTTLPIPKREFDARNVTTITPSCS